MDFQETALVAFVMLTLIVVVSQIGSRGRRHRHAHRHAERPPEQHETTRRKRR